MLPVQTTAGPDGHVGRCGLWLTCMTMAALALVCDPLRAEKITFQDGWGDARPRRTDSGANGPIGLAEHTLPDLFSITVGTWRPSFPQTDLFTGTWSNLGEFFRLDLVFEGLVNPPGPLACCGDPTFDPFRYGPNPVNGYIEIDVDADANTGGELEWPSLRYLGNASRFGGLARPAAVASRVAVDARAFDANLMTTPQVERSGEDFHLELVGWEVDSSQIQRSDTSDWTFATGETWVIGGHMLHRAHGYSRFSSACCRAGAPVGSYEPVVKVQFSHQTVSNRTTVSLVYPLTNSGAAAMLGAPVEQMDVMFTNQNSVQEALWELVISAMVASPQDRMLPEFVLIAPWENKNPDNYLDPAGWQVRALLGGSYTSPQDSLFVWSDIYPNVLAGDVDGNGVVNMADLQACDAYIQANDANPAIDSDGDVNGSIEIANFGSGFSLCDLNYDGLVDSDDRAVMGGPLLPRADFDRDGDVDQVDFSHMQVCLSAAAQPVPGCRNADLNRDGLINQDDLLIFAACASGPSMPADPACGRP